MSECCFAYSIGSDDSIASVSDAWLEFAHANAAPELTRDSVVGRPLWDFVAGRQTQSIYRDLFRQLRERGTAIELPFRCDSPDRFRFMRLKLDPGPADTIDCQGVLIREQRRPTLSILDRAFPRSDQRLTICSFCKKTPVIQLYGAPWSRSSRCLWMPEELGVEYQSVPVAETRDPEFLAINPNGRVPALEESDPSA